MTSKKSNQYLFEKCSSLEDIYDLRNQYLDGLIEPQELYLELMVRNADAYTVILNDIRIGYFLLGEADALVEYYITQKHIDLADAIFPKVIQDFSIRKALCKSFDHLLLSCCVGIQSKTSVLGIHFREYHPSPAIAKFSDVTVRHATSDDEKHIIEINEEVFDHDHEVLDYINKKQLLLFEKDSALIGFGIFSRVIEGKPDFDIGMLVVKDFRGQGAGQFIIGYMADYCIKNGWRPIAGCGVDNIGSRRCLEKAGFIAGYRILAFDF